MLTSWFPKNISEEIALAPPNFFTASSWGVGLDDLALNAARELREFLLIDYDIFETFNKKAYKILLIKHTSFLEFTFHLTILQMNWTNLK